MKRAIIFGATDTGKRIYHNTKKDYDIIGFVDGDPLLTGKMCEGFVIDDCSNLNNYEFDYVIIVVLTRYHEVKAEIINKGIPEYKIIGKYIEIAIEARIEFLRSLRKFVYNNINGATVELGVYQGEFAKLLMKYFQIGNCIYLILFMGYRNMMLNMIKIKVMQQQKRDIFQILLKR